MLASEGGEVEDGVGNDAAVEGVVVGFGVVFLGVVVGVAEIKSGGGTVADEEAAKLAAAGAGAFDGGDGGGDGGEVDVVDLSLIHI